MRDILKNWINLQVYMDSPRIRVHRTSQNGYFHCFLRATLGGNTRKFVYWVSLLSRTVCKLVIVYGHFLPSADSRRAVVSFW